MKTYDTVINESPGGLDKTIALLFKGLLSDDVQNYSDARSCFKAVIAANNVPVHFRMEAFIKLAELDFLESNFEKSLINYAVVHGHNFGKSMEDIYKLESQRYVNRDHQEEKYLVMEKNARLIIQHYIDLPRTTFVGFACEIRALIGHANSLLELEKKNKAREIIDKLETLYNPDPVFRSEIDSLRKKLPMIKKTGFLF